MTRSYRNKKYYKQTYDTTSTLIVSTNEQAMNLKVSIFNCFKRKCNLI